MFSAGARVERRKGVPNVLGGPVRPGEGAGDGRENHTAKENSWVCSYIRTVCVFLRSDKENTR